jgi:hypothetical protein
VTELSQLKKGKKVKAGGGKCRRKRTRREEERSEEEVDVGDKEEED